MILIVEDDAGIRELEEYALQSNGFDARGCEDAAHFWAALRTAAPELVILDVMLPGLDGASIVKIMGEDEALSSTPVIVTSALVESEKMFVPYPQVKSFCSKPFALTEFVAKVKQAIGD